LIHQLPRRAEGIGQEVVGGRAVGLRWWIPWEAARSAKLSAKLYMFFGKESFLW